MYMTKKDKINRKQIYSDSLQYVSASIFAQLIGLIRSVFIPIILTPIQLGTWNLMNVIIGYCANSHLGIIPGFNKKIPNLRKLGSKAEYHELKDSVFWLNLILGIITSLILIIFSFTFTKSYSVELKIVAGVVILQNVYIYFLALFRADKKFSLVSKGIICFSTFSSILVVLLSYLFSEPVFGALTGLIFGYLLVVVYWVTMGGYNITICLSWYQIRDAFKIGFPLITLSLLNIVLMSMDRWLILWKLSVEDLGFYALGIIVCGMFWTIPISIANVLYPRMIEQFASTGDRITVGRLLLNPVRAIASSMVLFLSIAIILLPIIISCLLPKYNQSIPLLEILVPGAYFLSIGTMTGNYIVSVNQQSWLIKIHFFAIVVGLLVDFSLLHAGFGVHGIAYGTICCYATYSFGYLLLALRFATNGRKESVKIIIQMGMLYVAMITVLKFTNLFVLSSNTIFVELFYALIRFCIVIIFLSPFIWILNRNSGVLSEIKLGLVKLREKRRN